MKSELTKRKQSLVKSFACRMIKDHIGQNVICSGKRHKVTGFIYHVDDGSTVILEDSFGSEEFLSFGDFIIAKNKTLIPNPPKSYQLIPKP